MTATHDERLALCRSMLRRIIRITEDADLDDDADPWEVIETIRIAAEDVLVHVEAASFEADER